MDFYSFLDDPENPEQWGWGDTARWLTPGMGGFAAISNFQNRQEQAGIQAAVDAQAKDIQAGADKGAAAVDPFAQAGIQATQQQQALAGLLGPEAQQQALAMLQNGPEFQAMLQQSEQAILANASATGGLRGGNVQQALAQNRPALLSQIIDQQYGRLGGLSQAGLSAAGQQAGIFTDTGQQLGAARSGGLLAQLDAQRFNNKQAVDNNMQLFGLVAGLASGRPTGGF